MPSFQAFSALVDLIHNAALAPDRWSEVIDKLAAEVRASVGGLVVRGPSQGLSMSISTTGDPAAARSYESYFGAIDPVIPLVQQLPEGTLLTHGMILSRTQLHRTEFYNDWVRPQHVDDCLTASLIGGGTSAVLALGKPAGAGNFKADALDLVRMLLPHFQTAIRIQLQLQGLTIQRDGALQSLDRLWQAVFFVDANERVVFANRGGRQLLREQDGLLVGKVGLRAVTSAETSALRRLIARAIGSANQHAVGGSLSLARLSGRRPLAITVMPLCKEMPGLLPAGNQLAMVLVVVPDREVQISREALGELFGLTPAETGVAQAIAKGLGLKAAARELGVAPSTARTHLLRIFTKTGTQRQAELVHVLGQLTASQTEVEGFGA
jgi:DNA-binding CsgD family transcriptional regulator